MQEEKLSRKHKIRWGYNDNGAYIVMLYEETWWGMLNSAGERVFGRRWRKPFLVLNRTFWGIVEFFERRGRENALGAFPTVTNVYQLYPDPTPLEDMLN